MPYRIYVPPDVFSEIKQLPGHIRQRIKRFVDSLVDEMRPSRSTILNFPTENETDDEDDQFVNTFELRRYRLDDWRVVYAIDEELEMIYILAVRKRPPYDYDDLDELIAQLL